MAHRIIREGQEIPVIALFSPKGGVGKVSIAQTFADVLTLPSDQNGRHPNVLLVDLSAYERGLTVTMRRHGDPGITSVHEYLLARSDERVDAMDVSRWASESPREAKPRGKLYFMPSGSGREDPRLIQGFDGMPQLEVRESLSAIIQKVVDRYQISCVIVVCEFGWMLPYSIAAAELATTVLLVGLNESVTYESFGDLRRGICELDPDFNLKKMKLVVNKRRWLSEQLEELRSPSEVFFAIPFTLDIVSPDVRVGESRGFAWLLFDKYVADLVERVLSSHPGFIADSSALLDQELMQVVVNAPSLLRASRMVLFERLAALRIAGALMVLAGVLLLAFGIVASGGAGVTSDGAVLVRGAGLVAILVGTLALVLGSCAARKRKRIAEAAGHLIEIGPDWIFQQIEKGPAARRLLVDLWNLSKALSR